MKTIKTDIIPKSTTIVDIDAPKELDKKEEAKGLTLDSPMVRNRIAQNGLLGLMKMKPAPFYLKEYAGQIEVGNLEDDLGKLKSCDWVIEVVIEYMPIKLDLLKKLVPNLAPGAILTTNTSGLSVNEMAEVLPPEIRKNFLATHFFNPPRYMRLMEIVPCKDTDPAVTKDMADFISLQKTREESEQSWIVEIADVDDSNYDLSVKNPNTPEEAPLRSPQEILTEIEELDLETASGFH